MEKMFENAKFGDRFKTRDGELAVYVRNFNPEQGFHYLLLDKMVGYLAYKDDGQCNFYGNKGYDIVGRCRTRHDKGN